jgi:hypothetical protein
VSYPSPSPSPGPGPEEEIEQKIQPQDVIDLWNEMADTYSLPTVRRLTNELTDLIKKACRTLPYRKDWVELLSEIPLSSTLQGKIGDGNWAPSLGVAARNGRALGSY